MENISNVEKLSKTWQPPAGILGWLMTVNQKNIGKRYLVTSFIFFGLAGILGLIIRVQLAIPENTLIGPDLYNQIFTLHGTTMMFLFAIPAVEGFGVYLIPLMIGTRDMSFPRLSTFSYFVFVIGGVVLWLAFFLGVAPDAGWFNYVPLADREYSPSMRIDFYLMVITFIEIAALAAAVEIVVTILKQRAPGMTLAKTPPFVWSMLVAAFMIIFAMPGVVVASLMLELDRVLGTAFFKFANGGDPLLWQHLFWWFGHPEVYIAFLPATGIVSTIVPVFCRRPLFAYNGVIIAIVATGLLSFGLWVHHMFTTGIPVYGDSFFTAASAIIAIPSGLQVFAWLATIWGGRPIFHTPFLFCLGFIIIFVAGGLTGVMVAMVPFDRQVHDSYFVVAHFHYVLIGGVVFPLIAGLYYWWPNFTGRLLSERLGKFNFWFVFIGFNLAFFPQHFLGFQGMPRRVYTYLPNLGWEGLNLLSTVGAFILAFGLFLLFVNIMWSMWKGPYAVPNPWSAGTLEWATGNPVPGFNFATIPRVHSLDPLWHDDLPLKPGIKGLREDQREVVITSFVDAEPQAVVVLPGPTIWPFLLAVALGVSFVGFIFNIWWMAAGLAAASMAIIGWFWNPVARVRMTKHD